MQIYVANPNKLEQIASVTIAHDLSMIPGDRIFTSTQLTVPKDAQRTSLIARLSENITMTVFIVYGNIELAPYHSTITDNAITPLSYVLATTPEYSTLQTQYSTLQTQFKQVQQTLNQTQKQLGTDISQQAAANAHYQSTINQLNDQITSANANYQSTITTYQELSLVLGFMTAALAGLCVYQRATRPRENKALVETVTVAKSAQMSETVEDEPKRNESVTVAKSAQVSDTVEDEPKRKSNLKKIIVAAIIILVIVVSAWMAAGYYYSNASTIAQTNANTTTSKYIQVYSATTHSTTTTTSKYIQVYSATTTSQTSHTSVTTTQKASHTSVSTRTQTSTTATSHSVQTTHT
jgi:uncharacterized protein YxeA